MPSGVRLQKIADRIREEISDMLIKEISDPRLHDVYVTDVRVDRVDLRSFPRLRFHWDPTPEHADHIEQILAQLREEKK
jgi:ribosome-binding factor A